MENDAIIRYFGALMINKHDKTAFFSGFYIIDVCNLKIMFTLTHFCCKIFFFLPPSKESSNIYYRYQFIDNRTLISPLLHFRITY